MNETKISRAEHLRWCKDRAIEYAKLGDCTGTIGSFLSDISKHEGTEDLAPTVGTMSVLMKMGGHLETPEQLTKWIEGLN